MSQSGGQFKGMVIQVVLGGIRSNLSPDEIARVRERLDAAEGAGTFERLEGVRRLAWVSVEDFVALTRATYDALGEQGYVAFWRKQGKLFFTDGAFAAIVRGFQAAFGFSAASILRALGAMWELGSKDAGHFAYKDGANAGEGTLLLEAPEPVLRPFFLLGLCEGLGAAFDLAQVEGTLKPGKRSDGAVELEVRWARKAPSAERRAS